MDSLEQTRGPWRSKYGVIALANRCRAAFPENNDKRWSNVQSSAHYEIPNTQTRLQLFSFLGIRTPEQKKAFVLLNLISLLKTHGNSFTVGLTNSSFKSYKVFLFK